MKCNECKTGDISIDKLDSKYLVRCSNCSNEFNITDTYEVGIFILYNYELEQENSIASSFSRKKESEETTKLQIKYDDAREFIDILTCCHWWFGYTYTKMIREWIRHNP